MRSRDFYRSLVNRALAWTLLFSKMLSVVGVQRFWTDQKEIFRNAVDNSGDSVGLVADWLTFECWWKFDPPAAGGSCDCAGNQSRDRPASCLGKDSSRARRKDAKENH